MKKPKILLIDDDPQILSTLGSYLRESGFEIITATNCREGSRINNVNVDLVLLDLKLPDGSGLKLLQEFKSRFDDQPVVMISGEATFSQAIEAVKIGAVDFLEKPVSPEKVEIAINNALKLTVLQRRLRDEQESLKSQFVLVGNSEKISCVRGMIDDVAATDSSVLLLGESGTGKEVAANLIHLKSERASGPLVAVNTAAIPSELIESEMFGHEKGAFTGAVKRRIGKFEQASGGTLFLDEIAEMPALLQSKLLRVIEQRKIERVGSGQPIDVDFRLICATNRNLQKEISEGNFRQDLYFRINVFAITLPPLREIAEDIEQIADFHLDQLCQKMGRPKIPLSAEIYQQLRDHHFPGNVRELRNILEHLLITSKGDRWEVDRLRELLVPSLVSDNQAVITLKEAIARFELEYIRTAIRECRGNVTRAAERLGLDRSYLYRKIRMLGIDQE